MNEGEYKKELLQQIQTVRANQEIAARAEVASLGVDPVKGKAKRRDLIRRGQEAVTQFETFASEPQGRWRQTVRGARGALHESILFDGDQLVAERIVSLGHVKGRFGTNIELAKRAIHLLGNSDEEVRLRREVLSAIQAAIFFGNATTLAGWRPSYIETLRRVADSPIDALAQDALEVLAMLQDSWALERLRKGLRDASSTSTPPAQAIQYLSVDDHGNHFDLLREIAQGNQEELAARVEAVQALASDPASGPLLQTLVQAPLQPVAVRQAALLSLRLLDKTAYQIEADRIIADSNEDASLRAAAITALRLDDDNGRNATLTPIIAQVRQETQSPVLQRAADLYLPRER